MHGQRRTEYKAHLRDDKISEALSRKAQNWQTLSSALRSLRINNDIDNDDNNVVTVGSKEKDENKNGGGSCRIVNREESGERKQEECDGMEKKRRYRHQHHQKALKLSETLLSVNPDPTDVWNQRREALLFLHRETVKGGIVEDSGVGNVGENKGDGEGESKVGNDYFKVAAQFLKGELVLTSTCLKKNPKSYGAWHHRKWSLRTWIRLLPDVVQSLSPPPSSPSLSSSSKTDGSTTVAVLQGELGLCAEFLSIDGRNFHCWSYRRFVVSALAFVVADPSASTSSSSMKAGDCPHRRRQVDGPDGSWDWALNVNNEDRGNDGKEIDEIIDDRRSVTDGEEDSDVESDNGRWVVVPGTQIASSPSPFPDYFVNNRSHSNEDKEISSPLTIPNSVLSPSDLLKTEWDFTTEKIHENFSNCSAFHHRSVLLPLVHRDNVRRERLMEKKEQRNQGSEAKEENKDKRSESKEKKEEWKLRKNLAMSELDLVRNAVFTEPDDQTSWLYQRFVICWVEPSFPSSSRCSGNPPSRSSSSLHSSSISGSSSFRKRMEAYIDILENECEEVRDLVESEDWSCKWAILSLHFLMGKLGDALQWLDGDSDVGSSGDGCDSDNERISRDCNEKENDSIMIRKERNSYLETLMSLDPIRSERYQGMIISNH